MSLNMDEKDAPASVDQSGALQKCISLFKAAKNDNERFASLLLVTRLVKSSEVNGEERRVLFDAIGFTFINRLLNTTTIPEDCSGGVYQSLAVAILACFATDQELILHPQMVAKIPMLNQIISNPSSEKPVVDDAYQILDSLSLTSRGSDALLKKETIKYLCEIISKEILDSNMTWIVLLNMATSVPKEMWLKYPKDLIKLLSFSANKMRTLQDMDKFAICKNILVFLSHAETAAFREALKSFETDQWIIDLRVGLRDILQSKVTTIQRDPALMLVSVVADLMGCGLKWVFCHDTGSKINTDAFFILVVTSVSVEIRIILDDNSTEEIIEKSTLLTSCYNIMENVIAYLITADTEDDNHDQSAETIPKLDQGMISKLYTQVTEAMMSVLVFLQQEAVNYEDGDISEKERQLVIASARVLCAWLAEESMALRKEVNKVLPFLVRLAKDTMASDTEDKGTKTKAAKTVTFEEPMETESAEQKQPIEMLPFMLPAMCHFSAHEESRKILVENHTHHVLVKYYSLLWKRFLKDSTSSANSKTSMVTLLGVLLNFAVTEPTLVQEDQSFLEIQRHIVLNLPMLEQFPENVVLVAHLVVLGLMLTRQQKESNDFSNPELKQFFESSINFLKEANGCLLSDETASPLRIACQKDWKNISELWFLGVQVLKACATEVQSLDVLMKENRWLDNVKLGD